MSNAVQGDHKDENSLAEITANKAGDALKFPGIETLLRAEPVEHCLIWR